MFENHGDAVHEHDLLVTKRPEKQIPSPPGWEEQQKAIAQIGMPAAAKYLYLQLQDTFGHVCVCEHFVYVF